MTYAFSWRALFARRQLFCVQKEAIDVLKAELLTTGPVLVVTVKRKQMLLLGIWSLTLFGSGPAPVEH